MRPLLLLFLIGLSACDSSHEANAAGDVTTTPSRELADAIAQNDELKPPQDAIEQGHPWRATQLIAPMLRTPQKRTPAALLVAARAAAGWDGWTEVEKLLGRETWLDSQFDGEGRELLTRAALERGNDTSALTNATAALTSAKGEPARSVRLVLLARALERSNNFDSAAATYARAAEGLRLVRDWLQLRVAGTQSDSAKRAKAVAGVTVPAAKARVPWTEAQARERFRDPLGAATRFAALGSTVQALRLRLSAATDSASRDVVKGELLGLIRARAGTADARSAVEVLDKGFTTLSPSEELIIARGVATGGPPGRAVAAFGRAFATPALITPSDRLLYGQVLARAGRPRDAIAQLEAVQGPLAGQAGYQRARVLLTSSTGDATRSALRDVVARFPSDTGPASAALFLLADLSTDDGNDDQARTLFQQLYRGYPSSTRAGDARFNAAVITFAMGDAKTAAPAFDSLFTTMPRSDEALAARYWSGRAWAAAGNAALAKTRWREVVAQQPASYYSFASAKRLGERPWSPPAGPDSVPHIPAVDSAMARAELLERLGMDTEARFEYEALEEAAAGSPDRMRATARALLAGGQPSRAMRLAQKLIDGGKKDAPTFRLAYPLVDRDELVRDAKAHDLDPILVAALIRQESNFNPHAVSVAGARGLMQVLPAVGEEVARALKYPVWYSALLTDADANLQLGTAHLASYFKQYGTIPRVLAAYNAGGSRVTRWSTKTGMDDPELFAERIPFVETRDYVRLVQRNAVMYANLYDLKR